MSFPQNKKIKFSLNTSGEKLISKTLVDKQRRKKQVSAYYSFLTIVLLFCLIQMSFSAILNVSKVVAYQRKIKIMKDSKKQVLNRNEQLKAEIHNFSTSSSWESIARNNLKMAGDNEILVIINDTEDNTLKTENKNGKQ
ncbi:MAG: hypothetical protein DKM22_02445 [Candidatus Melainabacteria bacterium]|nr:MAG: hypothetical protein DKM22_02445 [Candidatus Melainabacteria bacterium]